MSSENVAGMAKLTMPDGREIDLPVLVDTEGNNFIDIRKLQPTTGLCTFDPGYTSTGSCSSTITYIDGDQGILRYRGVPIEQLAEKGDFIDTVYLLLHGELPTRDQRTATENKIKSHMLVHESLIRFYRGFRSDAHPMAIMVGVVGALSSFYHNNLHLNDRQEREMCCYRLIAKMPTIAAIAYKTAMGQPIVYPREDLSYAENFLYMMHAIPTRPYRVDPVLAHSLEVILLLHADHEQNASTSTVRIAGSSQANPYACVAAGIASLWGPAHGGANEAVLKMLQQIGHVSAIPECVQRAKDKNDSFRLMGFGHRVYKNYDPRAKLMREMCHRVLKQLKLEDPLLDIAMELERVALSDEYFVQRKLYPNVDFYSGIVLRALGIPVEMYTVLFALGRTPGWVAQWLEMSSEPVPRIGRPRQMYVGYAERPFLPVAARGGDPDADGQFEDLTLDPSSPRPRLVSTHFQPGGAGGD